MSTEPMTTRKTDKGAPVRRLATRQELTQFYRAIGIPAVASAIQASKMRGQTQKRAGELPAFLRDAHAVI